MPDSLPFPDEPEVAVAVIVHEDRILAVHNRRWGVFTLPMTKRKTLQDPDQGLMPQKEEWDHAASRAAVEALGRTLPPGDPFSPLLELNQTRDSRQSDADGYFKIYHLGVFGFQVADTRLPPGVLGEWVQPADFLTRRPVSPTAQFVIKQLQQANKLPPNPGYAAV